MSIYIPNSYFMAYFLQNFVKYIIMRSRIVKISQMGGWKNTLHEERFSSWNPQQKGELNIYM
jgi:hypothetical protein